MFDLLGVHSSDSTNQLKEIPWLFFGERQTST
jgi:hypothetical protein